MHQAYNVHSILKKTVHIESIAAYGNNVILGTESGQLIMYSVDANSDRIDLRMFNKNFSKKAITQMEAVASEHLLFVLTDGMIHVCDMSCNENNFSFIHSSTDTKGCSLFTLDVKTPKSETGKPVTVIRVCCAIKRRLQFFYWKPDTLKSPDCSIELKDVPKALCWVNDIVCVGFKDKYVIYNIQSRNKPEQHDLKVNESSHVLSFDPCICLIKKNILCVSKNEYLLAIDPSEYVKEHKKPQTQGTVQWTTASAEVKTTLKPMLWSSPLLGLVWDEPFAIGRVTNGIEVRCLEGNSLNKETLIQCIPELNKVKYLVRSDSGIIFAAATSELWCIRMVDISLQRKQLLQQKQFHLAIELTNVSDETEEIKSTIVRDINMSFARELFESKEFSAAMTKFGEANAPPYFVISLFPNLLQDKTNKLNAATEEAGDVAVPVIPMPQLDDKDLENALIALSEFLVLARQKEKKLLSDTKSTDKTLLSIIDTTLLKCYLQTNESLIAPLIRLNEIHFEESEKALKKYGKISNLKLLYKKKEKHKQALQLLRAQASIEGSVLYGYEHTISYLQELGSAHLQLIFEFADWVLSQYPEEGLRIFTANIIEVQDLLPRAKVLDFLLIRHKALAIPYLEHVVHVWQDSNTFIHNVLLKQYREKVQSLMEAVQKDNSEENSENVKQLRQYRTKLYDLLQNSSNYSPDVALQDFPTNIMLEERALILGRLKKHEKVLAIYIQILGDVSKAAEYCEENYEDDNDIFLTLLKTILNPPKQPPYPGNELHPDFIQPNQDVVVDLLNKYATKINPNKVWPYLPDEMPLHRLSNYIDTVLRTQMAERHHLQIMKGLLSAEIQRVKGLIQEQESKSVEITEFSTCPECKKRFANQSPFVRYPNGEVVHLSCHDKKAQQTSSN